MLGVVGYCKDLFFFGVSGRYWRFVSRINLLYFMVLWVYFDFYESRLRRDRGRIRGIVKVSVSLSRNDGDLD